eukprot:PhM_4_TR2677/c0_g1_i1/m.26933
MLSRRWSSASRSGRLCEVVWAFSSAACSACLNSSIVWSRSVRAARVRSSEAVISSFSALRRSKSSTSSLNLFRVWHSSSSAVSFSRVTIRRVLSNSAMSSETRACSSCTCRDTSCSRAALSSCSSRDDIADSCSWIKRARRSFSSTTPVSWSWYSWSRRETSMRSAKPSSLNISFWRCMYCCCFDSSPLTVASSPSLCSSSDRTSVILSCSSWARPCERCSSCSRPSRWSFSNCSRCSAIIILALNVAISCAFCLRAFCSSMMIWSFWRIVSWRSDSSRATQSTSRATRRLCSRSSCTSASLPLMRESFCSSIMRCSSSIVLLLFSDCSSKRASCIWRSRTTLSPCFT